MKSFVSFFVALVVLTVFSSSVFAMDKEMDLYKGYWGAKMKDKGCGKHPLYFDISFTRSGQAIMYQRCYHPDYPNKHNGVFNDVFVVFNFTQGGNGITLQKKYGSEKAKSRKIHLTVNSQELRAEERSIYYRIDKEIVFRQYDEPQTPFGWATRDDFYPK